MASNKQAACIVFGGLILVALYFAVTNTAESPRRAPQYQTEAQVMGMGVASNMRMNYGTPLSMAPELHFWAPGFNDPGWLAEDHPVVPNRHRYPSIPGGNVSTVMHKGWSAFQEAPPANSEWFLNPPEAAVL